MNLPHKEHLRIWKYATAICNTEKQKKVNFTDSVKVFIIVCIRFVSLPAVISYKIHTCLCLASLVGHSILDQIKAGWNYTEAAKGKSWGGNQCLTTWSILRLSPGFLWCTSSRAGNTSTPSPIGWSCKQSCHPGSSCLSPDPSPCPEDAGPKWRRAWPGEGDAEGAWLRQEGPIRLVIGSVLRLRSALTPAAQEPPTTYNLLQKQDNASIHVLLFLDCSVLLNNCWLNKRPCWPLRCCCPPLWRPPLRF